MGAGGCPGGGGGSGMGVTRARVPALCGSAPRVRVCSQQLRNLQSSGLVKPRPTIFSQ